MSQLAKPETFQDLVRDKVRTVIMESIPPEQIDSLILKEYDNMFKSPYHNEKSPFQKLVEVEIKAFMGEKLKEYVNNQMMQSWTNGQQAVTKQAIELFAPAALEAIASEVVQSALNNFRNQLQRY